MKVCFICEGSYPYIAGGVSSWVQMMIKAFPEIEFKIWSIATTREEMSEYKYQIPENVTQIETLYLTEGKFEQVRKKLPLTPQDKKILRKFMEEEKNDWESVLNLLHKYRKNLLQLLKSEPFYDGVLATYQKIESNTCFHDYLWNFRGMYLPFFSILKEDLVEADIYHAVSTGYAGILGSVASYIQKKPFLISEHGIYTREREEDIIRAGWVRGEFKQFWIDFFKKLSNIAYQQASLVTSLFETNQMLQVELGCPKEKIRIIPNGIDENLWGNLTHEEQTDGKFHIGAVVRVVPIKDIKTMILAFASAQAREPGIVLHIFGNQDESPEYYYECRELVKELGVRDVLFYGQVPVKEYLPRMDLLLLSSISEGQPLAVLEGMAAGIAHICTNVGNCKDLMEGYDGDDLGAAGFVTPAMDPEAMGEKIRYMVRHSKEREDMGKTARKRVLKYYRKDQFLEEYRRIYGQYGGG